MLVTIGLVYMIMVLLFGSLLLPFVNLSALIGLLMLIDIVVTNAIVQHDLAVVTNAIVPDDLAQHKIEAGTGVRTLLIQGARTHVHCILMIAAATILAAVPLRGRPSARWLLTWARAPVFLHTASEGGDRVGISAVCLG
jgi:multidrug efflux pump subunit AcrB